MKRSTFLQGAASPRVLLILLLLFAGSAARQANALPPGLSSHTLNTDLLYGGVNSATGYVSLNFTAPTGGAAVALASSDGSAATVPASVTVPAGSSSTAYTVTSLNVTSLRFVMLTATYNGGTAAATITIRPVALNGHSANSDTLAVNGQTLTGSVALSTSAPAGGVLVSLASSAAGAVTIPASVMIPGGASSATYPIAAQSVTALTPVTLTATLNGHAYPLTLTVIPLWVTSHSPSAPTVVGGNYNPTASVGLNFSAPTGGAVVSLTSSDPTAISVPAAVTIPAGSSLVSYTLTTHPTPNLRTVTLTATCSGSSVTTAISVQPYVLYSHSLNVTSIPGGSQNVMGTVSINASAPAGGIIVALSSSSPSANAPTSVTIPAGTSSANYPITTGTITAPVTVVLTASLNGTTESAALNLNPYALYTLTGPNIIGPNSVGTMYISLNGSAPAGGIPVTLTTADGTISLPGSVTIPAGSGSVSFPITTGLFTAMRIVTVTASYNGGTASWTMTAYPSGISSGAFFSLNQFTLRGGLDNTTGTITLAKPAPASGYTFSVASDNGCASTPGSAAIVSGAQSVRFTVTSHYVTTTATANIAISGILGNGSTTLTVLPLTLTSNGIGAAQARGGVDNPNGQVSLSFDPPVGGAVVALASSDTTAATVPASVTVNPAYPYTNYIANYPITTNTVSSVRIVTITATYNGRSIAQTLTVYPLTLAALSAAPATVRSGYDSAAGQVTLNFPPSVSTVIALSSSDTSLATVPANVTVNSGFGNNSASFTITTYPVTAPKTVAITAAYNGTTLTASLTLLPLILTANNITIPTARGGADYPSGQIVMNFPPSVNTIVALSTSDATLATVPASVTVGSGFNNFSAAYSITTYAVTTQKTVTITAAYNGVSVSTPITLLPSLLAGNVAPPFELRSGLDYASAAVLMNYPAPLNTSIALSSDNPAATVPASVTVFGGFGNKQASYSVSATQVNALTDAHLTAANAGTSLPATLRLYPLTLAANTIGVGAAWGGHENPSGSVAMNYPVPAAAVITLSSDNPAAASVPSSVTVSVGSSLSYAITTFAVAAPTLVHITATYHGVSFPATLLVNPKIVTVSGTLTLEGAVNTAQTITFEFRDPNTSAVLYTRTQSLTPNSNAAQGTFAVMVPIGNYSLRMKGAIWLAAAVPVNASSSDVSGVTALLLAADANNDNSVDATDFGVLVSAYNTFLNVPGSGYDPTADFNCDGSVDATDFGLLVGNYNTVGAK